MTTTPEDPNEPPRPPREEPVPPAAESAPEGTLVFRPHDWPDSEAAATPPSRYDPPTDGSPSYPGGSPEYGSASPAGTPYGGSGQSQSGGAPSRDGQPTPERRPAFEEPSGQGERPKWGDRFNPDERPAGERPDSGRRLNQQPPLAEQEPYSIQPGGQPPMGEEPYSVQRPFGGGPQNPPPPPTGPYGGRPGDWQPQTPGSGLAVASLVLGVAGLFLLVVCGLGVLLALVGLVLGIVAVAKKVKPGMAWAGIGLSVLTLLLAVFGMILFVNIFGDCFDLPSDMVQRCVEQKWRGGS